MASIWDNTSEKADRLLPKEGGVDCFVTQIEYVEGEKMNKTEFLLVGVKGEDGIHREITQNFPDVLSGDSKYWNGNIAALIVFFSALVPNTDFEALKEDAKEKLGEEFTHKDLHEYLMSRVDPNYHTIPVKYLLVYPIGTTGVVSKYANKPTFGNFIQSQYRKKDLAEFDPKWMSLVKGAGAEPKPDQSRALQSTTGTRASRDY